MGLSRRRLLFASLVFGAGLVAPAAIGAPLWLGARHTEEDRARAISRGLRFVYRTALKPKNFAEYGEDYLWCFHTISATSADPELKRTARAMGEERARTWRRLHPRVPDDASADDIAGLAYGSHGADLLGYPDPAMQAALARTARRFRAADFLNFDPKEELPPRDVPQTCTRCDNDNPRGTRRCLTCGNKLEMSSPYDVLCDTLIMTYSGDSYGVWLGASYADAARLLPRMRPYRGYENGSNPEFIDIAYAVTHVVFTMNHYGAWRLRPDWLPDEFEFLKANLRAAIALKDPETMGEFVDSLKAFGLTAADPLIRTGIEYLLATQNRDGSWGDVSDKDVYQRYHPTWTAIDGLRDYAYRGDGVSFPDALAAATSSTR